MTRNILCKIVVTSSFGKSENAWPFSSFLTPSLGYHGRAVIRWNRLRCRFLYGCKICSSSYPKPVEGFGFVHHASIKLAIGAFKVLPIPSFLVDAGVTSLDLHQQSFIMSVKLSYKQICMGNLQKMIDTNRLRTDIPIDVTQIANTKLVEIKSLEREGGIILEDDGIDHFKARINIEVQWTSEAVIAAVERNGGFITTAYYDFMSLDAAVNPDSFFKRGQPIPRRMVPPQDLIGYYTDPKNRGYLADPALIAKERFILAQKYGYELPDVNDSPNKDMLLERKDPRQIFFGLEPGWIVNLCDKVILKPNDPELKEYYAS